MKAIVRSLAVGGAAAACAATLVLPSETPTPTDLLSQTLYMRGTRIGNFDDQTGAYPGFAEDFIESSVCADGRATCSFIPIDPEADLVVEPGGFWPLSNGGLNDPTYDESVRIGLAELTRRIAQARAEELEDPDPDDDVLVYGYSSSAVVTSLYMRLHPEENNVYVLIGNPMKPNGGILERFVGFTIPILEITTSGATPNEGGFTAHDISRQYDGWSDFPNNPLNLLSTANAIVGIAMLHGQYHSDVVEQDRLRDPEYGDTWQSGDTTYYLIDTPLLPLLMPLESAGVPRAVLLGFDAPLRVLVEAGYNRDIDPGTPTPADFLYFKNPVEVASNFVSAIPVGIDDGIEAATTDGTRPLGTVPAGQYGVGVEEHDIPSETSTLAEESQGDAQAAVPADGELDDESGAHSIDSPYRLRVRDLLGGNTSADESESRGPRHASGRPLRDIVNRLLGDDDTADATDDASEDADDDAPEDDNSDTSDDAPSES